MPDSSRPRITARQREVLELLAEGVLDTDGLARALVVSPHTVKYYVRELSHELGLRSRGEIALWAVRHRVD